MHLVASVAADLVVEAAKVGNAITDIGEEIAPAFVVTDHIVSSMIHNRELKYERRLNKGQSM